MEKQYALDYGLDKTGFIEISHNDKWLLTGDLTLEIWVMFYRWPINWLNLAVKGLTDRKSVFCLRIKNAYKGQWFFGDGERAIPPLSFIPKDYIRLFEWTHIACVRKLEGSGQIYINGVSVSERKWPKDSVFKESRSNIFLLKGLDNKAMVGGQLGAFRLWSIARSGECIIKNMFLNNLGNERGLIGQWFPGFNKNNMFEDTKESSGALVKGAVLTEKAGFVDQKHILKRAELLNLLNKEVNEKNVLKTIQLIYELENGKLIPVEYKNIASILIKHGLLKKAREILSEGIRNHPGHIGMALEWSKLAMINKDWNNVIEIHEKFYTVFRQNQISNDIVGALQFIKNSKREITCNLCGSPFFKDMGTRKNVKCLGCGSLERTRLLYLYITNFNLINKHSMILHIAPEKAIYDKISPLVSPANYKVVDFEPERYEFAENIQHMDLCYDLEKIKDEQFDIILHSHVFEHLKCNYVYVLFHLHRILKQTGLHLCVIPFMEGYYDEYFGPITPGEAHKRFGQYDHVRRIGKKDIQNTFGLVIPIDDNYDVSKIFPPEKLLQYNIPEACWKGLSINTVLMIKKEDFRLWRNKGTTMDKK